jgi:hypothetical protein
MRCLAILLLSTVPALAADDPAAAFRAALAGGSGSPAARAAWDRLVAQGPKSLPAILAALDTPDTVAANWLRTAFDRIADKELAAGGQQIDVAALQAVVQDTKRQGRTRRFALDWLERLRPGAANSMLPGWLHDPEFRYEAVAAAIERAEASLKDGKREEAATSYRTAYDASRDVTQARAAAAGLKKLGTTVSVAEHLGFLRDWYIIGPFDAMEMKGFKTVYPPEQKVDLMASHPGKAGPVRWLRHTVPEAPSGHVALLNFSSPLGQQSDAVAYAYTEIRMPAARTVEFRGAADDNLTVFVNGERAFGFEEYRNGVRLDRHRFRVQLREGVNTVLVKVCQAPGEGGATEPNWEFLLRIVDETGKGIAFQNALK